MPDYDLLEIGKKESYLRKNLSGASHSASQFYSLVIVIGH
jgi:hypothetical protein